MIGIQFWLFIGIAVFFGFGLGFYVKTWIFYKYFKKQEVLNKKIVAATKEVIDDESIIIKITPL